MDVDLDPGWLKREMDDVAAWDRANRKIVAAANKAKKNGYTQPLSIEFTIPELRALAYMARVHLF